MKNIKYYINKELSNRGIHWKLQNWFERAKDGFGEEDCFSLDRHIAFIVSEGLRRIHFDDESKDDIVRLRKLTFNYSYNGNKTTEKEYNEMFKLLKKYFRGMWY